MSIVRRRYALIALVEISLIDAHHRQILSVIIIIRAHHNRVKSRKNNDSTRFSNSTPAAFVIQPTQAVFVMACKTVDKE